ncbi:MAG TPA: carboxymuconolactone decarboxylase family protein [Acidimicrobiales bacterium]|nr:carboxymuconolactone decarboxylase family protein [Acidimicrobiales bacterium]
MSEARVPRLSAADAHAAAEAAGIPSLMADLSVFRVLLCNPKVAKALQDMLSALLWQGELDGRLRELVIMRIGWSTASVYEWTQHWRVATGMGISADDLVGVRDWRAYAAFGPAERAVLAATDETLESGTIGPATWAECERHVGGPAELIELVVAIGNWRLFSSLLHSLEVPLEDGVAPWPPDGRAPTQ